MNICDEFVATYTVDAMSSSSAIAIATELYADEMQSLPTPTDYNRCQLIDDFNRACVTVHAVDMNEFEIIEH